MITTELLTASAPDIIGQIEHNLVKGMLNDLGLHFQDLSERKIASADELFGEANVWNTVSTYNRIAKRDNHLFIGLRQGNTPPENETVCLLDIRKHDDQLLIVGASRHLGHKWKAELKNFDRIIRRKWNDFGDFNVIRRRTANGSFCQEICDKERRLIGGIFVAHVDKNAFGYREVRSLPSESRNYESLGETNRGRILVSMQGCYRDLEVTGLSLEEARILFGPSMGDDMIARVWTY